jgi:hypothetical protein
MIIIADRKGNTDAIYHSLISKINVNIPIVLVSWVDDYIFNDVLLNLNDYILIDYTEMGWDWDLNKSGTHVFGANSDNFTRYCNQEYKKFDDFVKNNPPKLYFKRELLKQDATETLLPIEYTCNNQVPEIQTKEQFNARPINVFQSWGRSNENRLRIHAEILLHSYKKGFQVCDNLYYTNGYLSEEKGEKWVSLWIPHYARIDIQNLLQINNLSKLSLSWSGAGFKCFRTAEAPINSVMVMHKNNFEWTFGWDETNCILVDYFKEIEQIEQALSREDLYYVYVKGVENCKKYQLENYIPYLENIINSI